MINKVILMGRLTAAPELRRTQSGVSVTSFTLAVERQFAGKDGRREADFIDCVAWEKTAEFISKWFNKGQLVGLVGTLQTRKWEDKQGIKRTAVEVIASEAHFAEGKKENGNIAHNDGVEAGFTELSDDGDLPF